MLRKFKGEVLGHTKFHVSESGFTSVEVLVSILIAAAFLSVALQSIAVSAALRVRAQETGESTIWVENDLVVLNAQAKNIGGYDPNIGGYTNISDAACAATTSGNGYAAQLQNAPDNHPNSNSVDSSIGSSDTDQYFSSIGNREYTLERLTAPKANDPSVLQVSYRVYRGGSVNSSELIFRSFSEVVPGVVFACKKI